MTTAKDPEQTAVESPLIVDLGRRKKSAIKKLRRGEGTLVREVNDCIGELKSSGAISSMAQPVVILVREKRKPGIRLPFV